MVNDTKQRLWRRLRSQFTQFSQKQIKELISSGRVRVNNQPARPLQWVCDHDVIEADVPLERLSLDPNPKLDCRLIQSCKDYLFLFKPPRLHSVAQSFFDTKAVANWLLSCDPALATVSDPLESGLLHRLDFETSGVMVAARRQKAYEYLKSEWVAGRVEKIYSCVVQNVSPTPGVYEAFVDQSSDSNKKVSLSSSGEVPVVTEIVASQSLPVGFLLTVKLVTGFRHQIRAHLSHLGCPIVGDSLYGGVDAQRLMLQSESLAFTTSEGGLVEVLSPESLVDKGGVVLG